MHHGDLPSDERHRQQLETGRRNAAVRTESDWKMFDAGSNGARDRKQRSDDIATSEALELLVRLRRF
ncbi:uncharacterized protein PADG_12389 [Paracoccidioides brasiliensis Pb18]|uniref:Uncharacterized protein n=1 Tax=Paracoccidioides brasiliensis (strain Pb18) TaxID=502780 RepID=A0A0A0HU40_PARBD|nr:uncharacterized protein PADG_12389 [Paracoccidioides brasiliensis Pb18]KGM91531.1 hypothetical protein PADG_12389 [Paracoccidioides brasiliensis Pb18]